jgi:hypothetical protein
MAIVVWHVLTSMTGSFSPTEREHSVTGRHRVAGEYAGQHAVRTSGIPVTATPNDRSRG